VTSAPYVNDLNSSQLSLQLPQNWGLGERESALRNGPAPIPRRLSDQLALRHDQQKSVEIKI
jgi:hypothetical protein